MSESEGTAVTVASISSLRLMELEEEAKDFRRMWQSAEEEIRELRSQLVQYRTKVRVLSELLRDLKP